jgi:hypothetical protein
MEAGFGLVDPGNRRDKGRHQATALGWSALSLREIDIAVKLFEQ